MQIIKELDTHFDGINRMLVVAAHPGDAEIACGGTIAKMTDSGMKVVLVNCTSGDIGTYTDGITHAQLAEVRQQESDRAAEILGIEKTYNLGHKDGELVNSLKLREQLAQLYRTTQADAIITHNPESVQQHPDFRAAGQAAIDAYTPAQMPLYKPGQLKNALPSSVRRIITFGDILHPDLYVDVSEYYDKKLAACVAHESQYPGGMVDLRWLVSKDAKAGMMMEKPYAETFDELSMTK